ncbi:MAG TPA: hypothetical protein VIB39_06925 [Candidatus Angelobacter sp.]|jgi:hypothetical protein
MEELQAGDQTIRFDRERTSKAYAAIVQGDAERCRCASCLNFAAQRNAAYPQVFRSLLDRLGIDPNKEGEAYEEGTDGELFRYGGWFYLAGEIVVMGERLAEDPATGFRYWFGKASRLPKPLVDFGEKVIALEFMTRIPWIISPRPTESGVS